MLPKNRDYDKKLFRLVRILNRLESDGEISVRKLAEEFNVSMRTAQRDIELISMAKFPLVSQEKGRYSFMPGFSLKKVSMTNEEASLLAFLREIAGNLGGKFADSFGNILAKMLTHPGLESPYYAIMPKLTEKIKKNPLMADAETAIEESKKVIIFHQYDGKIKQHKLRPLKIIYHDGLWYLYGIIDGTKWDAKYRFDKITKVDILDETFVTSRNLAKILGECTNIWFGMNRKLKIVLRIDSEVADVFRKKVFFPRQKIKKETRDGSLIIESTLSHYMEAIPTIYHWIPHITVVAPKQLRDKIRKSVKQYLARI